MPKIPISVIVVTRNEERRIEPCLGALSDFDDVWVVDSQSDDKTCAIAAREGAQVQEFEWNGQYPKKRQWCLDSLPLRHDWVFFVDADEVVSSDLTQEIAALNLNDDGAIAGYFVKGRYVWPHHAGTKLLRFGLCNNKLALVDRRKIEFPVVDDLGFEGMGEIEGHYQPVLKEGFEGQSIGQLDAYLLHEAGDNWDARHLRYAAWEASMNARDTWPRDPVAWRQGLKRVFRALPFRGCVAFLYCYVLKLGVLDGAAGFDFACSRGRYYAMIANASKANKA